MAADLIRILGEVRGTGAPEAEYTDGIYHDITIKTTEDDGVTPRLGDGIYGSMQVMYEGSSALVPLIDELITLNAIAPEIDRLADSATNIDTIAPSIGNVDVITPHMDNVDTVAADIANINTVAVASNLEILSTIADDLNGIDFNNQADIIIVADDLILGVDSNVVKVSTDIANVNATGVNIASVNTVATDIANVNTTATNIANVNTTATNVVNINSVAVTVVPNIAEILLADDNAVIATTKAGEASVSAAASLVSEGLADADAVQTALDRVQTGSDRTQTGLDVIQTASDLSNTNQDTIDTAADLVATNQDTIDTAADRAQTALDVIATGNDVIATASIVTATQLSAWEAEAERLTAGSYATEAEAVFVNLVTSDGDGTFTYTPTADYSALHSAAKATTEVAAIDTPTIMRDYDYVKAIGNINNPLLDLPLNNSLAMKQGVGSVTFTRDTTATYIDRYGMLQYSAIDEPRFESDGLLIEGASTNLFTYSEDIANIDWNKARTTVSTDGTKDLDSISDATKLTDTIDDGTHVIANDSFAIDVSNKYFTKSIYAKAGNGTDAGKRILLESDGYTSWVHTGLVVFDLINGTVEYETNAELKGRIEHIRDGWYRCSILLLGEDSQTTTNQEFHMTNDTFTTVYIGNGTDYIYVSSPQFEELPFASSYIPTTDSAVTRSADSCSITTKNNFPNTYTNKPEITVAMDSLPLGLTGDSMVLWAIYQSSVEYIYCRYYTTDYRSGLTARSGAITNINYVNGTTAAPTTPRRLVTTMVSGLSSDMYEDGQHIVRHDSGVDNNLADFSIDTPIVLGSLILTESNMFFGHLKNFRIYPVALTATEIGMA